jgi:hypothetical protein
MAGLASLVLAAGPAWAQTLTIKVNPTVAAQPASQVAFPIEVGPAASVPPSSFVRLRGLPPMAALSDGHSIAPGSWAIPIGALSGLKITLPAATTGKSEISITLVGVDGSVLGETKSTLVIAASAGEQAKREPPAPAGPVSILRAGPLQVVPERPERPVPPVMAAPSAAPSLTADDRARALRFIKRGDEQLEEGNVAQARLLYEKAAEIGLAQGAMALASTYDADELARLDVRGIQGDRAAATRWYERARQLGAAEADQRLRRLGAK